MPNKTSKDYAQAIKVSAVSGINPPKTNEPAEYGDRRKQYFAGRTQRFVSKRARYASDYVKCEAQGLKKDFYAWTKTTVRLADITPATVNATRKGDNYKEVLFDDPRFDYFPIGAKLKTMGSVWIATNPTNISSVNATSVVGRCTTSYNSYDDYGNIVAEPLLIEHYDEYGNANSTPLNEVLPYGNFKVTAQLNEVTRRLGHNKRIILGSKAFHITGWNDFMQEFSCDRDSAHLLTFSIRLDEISEYDDMTNFIADGLSHSFIAEADDLRPLTVGKTAQISPRFVRDGKVQQNTEIFPVSWSFVSNDTTVATVSADGTVTAVAPGQATITATLVQNPTVSVGIAVTAAAADSDTRSVVFDTPSPQSIRQYTSKTFRAQALQGGEPFNGEIRYTFSDMPSTAYYAAQNADGSITVQCITPSDEKLILTAFCASWGDGITDTVEISLNGY